MARDWTLTRTEAENLVDLLEDCDPKEVGTWRHDLASELRELFGMVSLEEEKESRFVLRAQKLEDEGHTDKALNFLYDSVDDLMRNGEFSRLNTILESTAVGELSTDILLGVLTATLPARRRLPARPEFFGKVQKVLHARNEYEEGLLTGLEA